MELYVCMSVNLFHLHLHEQTILHGIKVHIPINFE